MLRLIFLLALLAVALLIVRKVLQANRSSSDKSPPQKKPLTDMVRCDYCGVHLPVNEAIKAGEHFYCSAEHKELAHQD
jgi:uncharacterized protein